jgi:raffinose/stachyose/melibiose transport system permease protein
MQVASGTLPRPRRRRNAARPAAYALALAVAAVVIVPVAYVVLGGFRTTGQVAAQPVALPDPWVFGNYGEVLRSGSFWRQVATSLLIAVMATAATVALGAGAAFALARYAFKGREALFTYFTLGLLFPVGVGILPLYILLRQLGLVDTPFGVALPEAAFGLPITIVILRPFMRAIPGELEDAAAMDGCGRFGFFWRILLPLSLPALVTVSILAFVTSWNAYLLPLLVLNDPDHWTLPLGVANWSTQYTQDTSKILAFTALSMLPALLFFVLAERRIVGGLTGAVKG